MPKPKHPDSTLIDRLGSDFVSHSFDLSPQTLHWWRVRGIPLAKRIAFAKLCAEQAVSVPDDFFAEFEGKERKKVA